MRGVIIHRCAYCGGRTWPGRRVCRGYSDLPPLEPTSTPAIDKLLADLLASLEARADSGGVKA